MADVTDARGVRISVGADVAYPDAYVTRSSTVKSFRPRELLGPYTADMPPFVCMADGQWRRAFEVYVLPSPTRDAAVRKLVEAAEGLEDEFLGCDCDRMRPENQPCQLCIKSRALRAALAAAKEAGL